MGPFWEGALLQDHRDAVEPHVVGKSSREGLLPCTIWLQQQRLKAAGEWFAGDVVGAIESYRRILERRRGDPGARAALVEIARLLDETASVDAEFWKARKALRCQIAHLLVRRAGELGRPHSPSGEMRQASGRSIR